MDLAKKLDELAKSLDRPKTYLIRKAYRLNNKDDRIVSEKELMSKLDL